MFLTLLLMACEIPSTQCNFNGSEYHEEQNWQSYYRDEKLDSTSLHLQMLWLKSIWVCTLVAGSILFQSNPVQTWTLCLICIYQFNHFALNFKSDSCTCLSSVQHQRQVAHTTTDSGSNFLKAFRVYGVTGNEIHKAEPLRVDPNESGGCYKWACEIIYITKLLFFLATLEKKTSANSFLFPKIKEKRMVKT